MTFKGGEQMGGMEVRNLGKDKQKMDLRRLGNIVGNKILEKGLFWD